MKQLMNKSKNKIIANEVIEANTFFTRARGLLGKSEFSDNSTMWFPRCSSIHTFFMKFVIDVVFVDKIVINISLE